MRLTTRLPWLPLGAIVVVAMDTSLPGSDLLGKKVIVHRKEDRPLLEGILIKEVSGKEITIEFLGAHITLPWERVARVELARPPREEVLERLTSCRTADDWLILARWCDRAENSLPEERDRCLAEASRLDSERAAPEGAVKQAQDGPATSKPVRRRGRNGMPPEWPPFRSRILTGPNELTISNPSNRAAVVGLRIDGKGVDVQVPARGRKTVKIQSNTYEVFIHFRDDPDAVYQGDSISLNGTIAILQLRAGQGNYALRRI